MSPKGHPALKVQTEDPELDLRHYDTPSSSSTTRFTTESRNPRMEAMNRSIKKMLTAFDTWFESHSTSGEKKIDPITAETVRTTFKKGILSRREKWLEAVGATKTDAEAYTVVVEWKFEREPTGFKVYLTVGGSVKLWSIGSTATTREEAEADERTAAGSGL